jgi:hypothetical protein
MLQGSDTLQGFVYRIGPEAKGFGRDPLIGGVDNLVEVCGHLHRKETVGSASFALPAFSEFHQESSKSMPLVYRQAVRRSRYLRYYSKEGGIYDFIPASLSKWRD